MFALVVVDNLRKIQCGGLLITQFETLQSIASSLGILQDHLIRLEKQWEPSIFMSDKDDGEIGAVKRKFPDAKNWLCSIHVIRDWNRTARGKCRNAAEANSVIESLKYMMYTGSEEKCLETEKNILRGKKKSLKLYLQNEWFNCKEQWCYCYRTGVYRNRIDTNNPVESFNKYVHSSYMFLSEKFDSIPYMYLHSSL